MSSGENRAVQCNGGVVGDAIALRATRLQAKETNGSDDGI